MSMLGLILVWIETCSTVELFKIKCIDMEVGTQTIVALQRQTVRYIP